MTQKEIKSITCRVTEKEKKLLQLLRVWEIDPNEVIKILSMDYKKE